MKAKKHSSITESENFYKAEEDGDEEEGEKEQALKVTSRKSSRKSIFRDTRNSFQAHVQEMERKSTAN